MKPLPIFFVTAAVAAATAFVVGELRSSSSAAPSAAAAAPLASDDVARLARSVDALDKRAADLQKGLDDLRMEVAKRSEPSRVPLGDIDAAVARALGAERVTRAADAMKFVLGHGFTRISAEPRPRPSGARARCWETAAAARARRRRP